MAITVETYVERVLIVFNADKTIKGAHSENIETVRDGSAVLAVRQGAAVPLVVDKIGDMFDGAKLAAQVSALQTALKAAEKATAAKQIELEAMAEQRDAAQSAANALQARVAELTAQSGD